MPDHEARCLDAFPEWLRELGADARVLAAALEDAALPEVVRRGCAAALNYLFKSVDLVPDGIEDLGFVDDAFV
ncbi:MAG TPA: YkvA family protein, partial [Polyangiaceae bacterium]|nr:YkvA family protein [Polyangiaceae bacterium]